jgi:glutamate racemase
MEPAVKPAAATTQSQVVGVLATPATFQGKLFASVVERFAHNVTVLEKTLPGLVEQIELGDLEGIKTREILEAGVMPLLEHGADTLVLACTHYPFIIPLLSELVGPAVQVIDPSPAIARQAARVIERHNAAASEDKVGQITYYTTGDPIRLEEMSKSLIGEPGIVKQAYWRRKKLVLPDC